jgi:hypothetical protein
MGRSGPWVRGNLRGCCSSAADVRGDRGVGQALSGAGEDEPG